MDCLEGLKLLEDNSINCCITSPPYYGLRNYNMKNQIGLEESPELYVEILTNIFSEVKRVLKNEGTLWLNLGDSYYGSGKGAATHPSTNKQWLQGTNKGSHDRTIHKYKSTYLKQKDLIGIPWMVAFALRASGWFLRQDIIWHKPNPMPESVTDRCTKSHEYIFLLSKSKKYYYDYKSIKTPIKNSSVMRMNQDIYNQKGSNRVPGKSNGPMKAVLSKGYSHRGKGDKKLSGHSGYYDIHGNLIGDGFANKKSVWTITTKPFKGCHFATFPQDLIIDCVKAGCPVDGVILDPFMGAGTTGYVAKSIKRNFVGFELNPEYVNIANERIAKVNSEF